MMYLNGASMVWGMYYTNQQYFESNCENKNLPELACHGKCQAMKEMRDLGKKQESFKSATVFPIVTSNSQQIVFLHQFISNISQIFALPLNQSYLLDFHALIINPPD